MREWTVAGGIVEGPAGVLLVRNRRRWGSHDWSPPGGVIDAEDADMISGLTREVREETGIVVTAWDGPVYEVSAVAPEMGWHLRAHIYVATAFGGDLVVEDPDGIVVDAAFVAERECGDRLAGCFPWVREPFAEWLAARWDASAHREYRYHVRGNNPSSIHAERLA